MRNGHRDTNFFDIKVGELKKLKMNLQKTRNRCDQILKKIETEGIEGYYSCNDEMLQYSLNVYTSLRMLAKINLLKEKK